jgi:hypothetical protein
MTKSEHEMRGKKMFWGGGKEYLSTPLHTGEKIKYK